MGKCMCSMTNISSHQAVSLILKCPDLWAPYIPKNWTPTRIEVVSGNKISLAVGIKDLFSQNQSLSHVIWLCCPSSGFLFPARLYHGQFVLIWKSLEVIHSKLDLVNMDVRPLLFTKLSLFTKSSLDKEQNMKKRAGVHSSN